MEPNVEGKPDPDLEDIDGADTDRLPGGLGDDGVQITAKSEMGAPFTLSDAEDEDSDAYVPVKTVILKENELCKFWFDMYPVWYVFLSPKD